MKHLIRLLESRKHKAATTECWTTGDALKRAVKVDEIDEIILDLMIIGQAEDKLPDFKIEDKINEIRVPVMKPDVISVEIKDMTASSAMYRPYWIVYFERDTQDRNKWNFKSLDNE